MATQQRRLSGPFGLSAALSAPGVARAGVRGGRTGSRGRVSEWRVLKPVVDGMPQTARDGPQSRLFLTAEEGTDDRAVRRELPAAADVLARQPVNEVEACGVHCRGVHCRGVRGDEFTPAGDDGLEPPRPTEFRSRPRTGRTDRPPALSGAAGLAHSGARFPAAVRAGSGQAVLTHPELVLPPRVSAHAPRRPGRDVGAAVQGRGRASPVRRLGVRPPAAQVFHCGWVLRSLD
ncbi:DUF5954 family protein [Streptomyces sp. 7R007]